MGKFSSMAAACLLTFALCGLAGCSAPSQAEDSTDGVADDVSSDEAVSQGVYESDDITVDNAVIDDSYEEPDHPSLRRLYAFTTVHPQAESIKSLSSYGPTMTIANGGSSEACDNAFDSSSSLRWCRSYYFDNTTIDVFVGEAAKIAFAFSVPESLLSDGAEITMESTNFEGVGELLILPSDIEHVTDMQEGAQAIDPDGYAAETNALEPADEAAAAQVDALLQGYDHWAYYGSLRNGYTFGYDGTFTNDISQETGSYRSTRAANPPSRARRTLQSS